MKDSPTLLIPLLSSLLSAAAGAQVPTESVRVGARAPALECTDTAGKKVDWARCRGKAAVLFFHSQNMPFSKRGLDQVCRSLSTADGLADELFLLIITNGSRDMAKVVTQLEESSLDFAVTVDSERSHFSQYRVIAFPTVFTLNKEQVVQHIDKGFGPRFQSKVLAAARHASGQIHEDIYRALVAKRDEQKLNKTDILIRSTLRGARHLIDNGMLAEARRALEKVLAPDTKHTTGMQTLADVLLRLGATNDAALWIERLAVVAPKAAALPLLRAELAILRKAPDEALRHLDASDRDEVRAIFLRGRAMEQKGRIEEAVKLYRKALRITLRRAA